MEQTIKSAMVEPSDMEKINRFTRRKFKQEEIYTFSVILCDNEIDRDHEAFTPNALRELAQLFLGKTGIFDHDPRGKNQSARIYDTKVEQIDCKETSYGMPYYCLAAKAYMVRSARCDDLILEIEAGIKKEVSVGCSMKKRSCSICGAKAPSECSHRPGQTYNGKLCYVILDQPQDAYEWSFVAVPAQKAAGVVKQFNTQKTEDLARVASKSASNAVKAYIQELEKRAHLGDRYLENLKTEVVQLGFLANDGLQVDTMKSVVEKMELQELEQFRNALTNKKSQRTAKPQLSRSKTKTNHTAENEQFKI